MAAGGYRVKEEGTHPDPGYGYVPQRHHQRMELGGGPDRTSTTMRSSRTYPDASPARTIQRDLNIMIQGDREYYTSPTMKKLFEMVARIMHQWEALTAEGNRMSDHVPSETASTTSRTKTARSHDEASTSAGSASASTRRKCQGCNRANHSRDVCRLRFHPDFNKAGSWVGSAAERAIHVRDSSVEVALPWKTRADGRNS